jgi:hypothetical protein
LLAIAGPCYLLGVMAVPRVVVIEGDSSHDVLDVVDVVDGVVRARTAFLFEIGEELAVRIENDGTASDAIARVRAHVGDGDARVTELELVG